MNLTGSGTNIDILDTTLRDGSYAINFQFTAGHTRSICRDLEAAGVRYIEVGHGVGLNASESGYGVAAATDVEYMQAASEACDEAEWGMFCIPGIARIEDLETAIDHDMGFVRVGTNITEVEQSEPFIQMARDHGVFVTANFMKSYARTPHEFAEKALLSEEYGAQMVYIVDSAGGMFPDTVRKYYEATRRVSDIPIGFHGHDNLGLAIANSMVMADEGAVLLDSSLQGLGRSAGNAPTEVLISVMEKAGYKTGIDLLKVLRLGHKYVHPLRPNPNRMPLDVVAGHAEFHSSFMPKILEMADRYGVDPARLILEVCAFDKVYAPEDVVEKIAEGMDPEEGGRLEDYGFGIYTGGEEDEQPD